MTDHPYLAFGARLRTAMTSSGWTVHALAAEIGVNRSAIVKSRTGRMMPGAQITARLAELLDAPYLVEMRAVTRQAKCAECGVTFLRPDKWRETARFCQKSCRTTFHSRVNNRLRSEEAAERRPDALALAKRRLRSAEARLKSERERSDARFLAIQAFCQSCEWSGVCRTPSCELRSESPFPLAIEATA